MRFRGQWLTGSSIFMVALLILLPLPNVVKYLVGGGLIAMLGGYFRYVSKQSHQAIVNDFRVKEQSRRLARRERMVAMGELSAVVMHEINNPLTYVEANAEMVMDVLSDMKASSTDGEALVADSDMARDLDVMMRDLQLGIRKVRTIADELRTSSRSSGNVTEFSLQACAREAIQVADARVGGLAAIVYRSSEADGQHYRGSDSRLQQVLVNLIVNAAQACAELVAREIHRTPRVEVAIEPAGEGKMVAIVVRDNGPGIPDDVLQRIFEPFFTTKSAEDGTGLGLSICRQWIEDEFGGQLNVRDTSNEGTSFEVLLPERVSDPSMVDTK